MRRLPTVVGRVAGGAAVVGVSTYQPMILAGIGALALLLTVGVVLPAVWSQDLKRQEAAVSVLHLLLTALCGARFAAALKTSPPPRPAAQPAGSPVPPHSAPAPPADGARPTRCGAARRA